jgi:ribosome recycling factor
VSVRNARRETLEACSRRAIKDGLSEDSRERCRGRPCRSSTTSYVKKVDALLAEAKDKEIMTV